jgi:hypothetical protein
MGEGCTFFKIIPPRLWEIKIKGRGVTPPYQSELSGQILKQYTDPVVYSDTSHADEKCSGNILNALECLALD